jgi:hypothetical protein
VPTAGEGLARVAGRLLGQYDRGEPGAQAKDDALSPTELGIDVRVFRRADADGDGRLDSGELEAFLGRVTPSIELVVAVDKARRTGASIDIVKAEGRTEPRASSVRRLPEGTLTIDLAAVRLEFRTGSGSPFPASFLLERFKNTDGDKNGYLDRDEARRDGLIAEMHAAAIGTAMGNSSRRN